MKPMALMMAFRSEKSRADVALLPFGATRWQYSRGGVWKEMKTFGWRMIPPTIMEVENVSLQN